MRLALVAIASLAIGCHHDKPATTLPTPATAAPAAAAKAAPPTSTPVSPHVSVSDDLAKQCALAVGNAHQAPKFDFDQFELLPEDRNVLEQVASCVTTGPLKGHGLTLVGRADPRGTEEYNLGLGDRRANAVGSYLEHLGVSSTQVATSTRGALDASGHDDHGWRLDRRVDLQLRN